MTSVRYQYYTSVRYQYYMLRVMGADISKISVLHVVFGPDSICSDNILFVTKQLQSSLIHSSKSSLSHQYLLV